MKTLYVIFCTIILLLGTVSSNGDILLHGPGVPVGVYTATQVPFKINYVLPNAYKFIFSGIQAKGDTLGAPGSSGINGNGGQFHLNATVSDSTTSMRAGSIEFRNVLDFNSSSLKTLIISPAAVFKATNTPISIDIEWSGQGNAHKPNGIFSILGEYQKDPHVPTGTINFSSGLWAIEGLAYPSGKVNIVRD